MWGTLESWLLHLTIVLAECTMSASPLFRLVHMKRQRHLSAGDAPTVTVITDPLERCASWAGLEPPDTPPDSPEAEAQLLSSSSSKPTIVPASPTTDSPEVGHHTHQLPPTSPIHDSASQVDLARCSEDSGLGTTSQCQLQNSPQRRRLLNPNLALDLSGVQRMPPSRSSSFASLSCAAHVGVMQENGFYSAGLEKGFIRRGQRDTRLTECSSVTGDSLLDLRARRRANQCDALVVMLSAVYAKLLVVMGICFPLAEVISHKIPVSYYEISNKNESERADVPSESTVLGQAFYLYLYLGSIMFLVYVYLFLLRSDHPPPSSPLPLKRDSSSKQGLLDRLLRRPQANGVPSSAGGLPRTNSAASGCFEQGLMKKKVDDVAHCGSFYLRLGAVAFGIGSMIYSGLEFGQFFEVDEDSHCYNILYSISPTAHMVFTFIQLYFIFLNSRMAINKYKTVARFGLMHMIATNLCIWLRVLVQETKHQIVRLINPNETKYIPSFVHDAFDHAFDPTIVPVPSHVVTEAPLQNAHHNMVRRSIDHTSYYSSHECRRSNIMGQLVQDASPFLFPCTIEYSLICAAILYIMWKNTGKTSGYLVTDGASLHSAIPTRHRHYYQVDCAKANKGLFTGILVLVLSIICLIVFFVLINKPQYKNLAVLEAHIAELALYCLTSLAVIIALYQVREMKFSMSRNFELDNILLVVAQTGLYLFTMFSIIGGHFTIDDNTILVLLTALACLVQGTLQTIFILDASRRCARNSDQVRRKPGREMVTFLLVCNFAMWAINTLETRRADSNPVQMHFYGFWAWTIITHVTTPLTIFFRFHSTVCLCDIWKRTYKVKADYV